MTPSERIGAVDISEMTDAQKISMLNYLLGALAAIADAGTSAEELARTVERAHKFGSLQK